MSCNPERVSALVDDALEDAERAAVEAHVDDCEACRVQAADERRLRAGLKALPAPELPFGLEQRVRRRLRGPGRLAGAVRLLVPLAAVLVVGLWVRGYAPFVAWELSRDHEHCFGMERLPAEVWGSEPEIVTDWFDGKGERLPLLPSSVGPLALVGGRFCRLVDASHAAHVYYASDDGQVSVFTVPHDVRMKDDFTTRVGENAVALVRVGRSVLGVVGEDEDAVGAFVSRLRTNVARLFIDPPPHPSPRRGRGTP